MDVVRQARLRSRTLKVAAISYCQNPSGLSRFAEWVRREDPSLFDADSAALTREITDAFLSTDVEVLGKWLGWQVAGCTKREMGTAKRLTSGVALRAWAEKQNAD